jgi:2-C-methyl-D-erythritol 2,4-cyclodiphosphate synthase
MMRIGLGIDVHAFAPRRPLILGGVDIAHDKGLAGHSDADVLTHAVMDALLGALRLPGKEDIGAVFPDSDAEWAGACSLDLLRQVSRLVRESGYEIVDVDSVLAAQAPRLTPYREQMRGNLAAAMGIEITSVGVKATTTEHLGFEGRGEGISAYATALLRKMDIAGG